MSQPDQDELDKLERLAALHRDGTLTDEEFEREKARLLNPPPPPPVPPKKSGSAGILILSLLVMAGVIAGGWYLLNRDTNELLVVSETTASEGIAGTNLTPPSASYEEEMAKATKAVFGNPPNFISRGEETVVYEPKHLITTGFASILISEGVVENAGHVSSGKVAIHYLNPQPNDMMQIRSYVPAVETGSFGQVADTEVNDTLSTYPVLETEGGGTWQGYSCQWVTLTELTPDGPVSLATIPLSYSNGGAVETNAEDIEGEIVNMVKNTSFDVSYKGTRTFTDRYVRKGNAYVMQGASSSLPTC
ncbi:MAG: SHOCT domain-containing protein [Asticcacaulis sp.]